MKTPLIYFKLCSSSSACRAFYRYRALEIGSKFAGGKWPAPFEECQQKYPCLFPWGDDYKGFKLFYDKYCKLTIPQEWYNE